MSTMQMQTERETPVAFGKDFRLLSEVTITGNKVGAGRRFYSMLAHNQKLFGDVVDFVEKRTKSIKVFVSAHLTEITPDPGYVGSLSWVSDVGPSGWLRLGIISPFNNGEDMLLGGEFLRRARELEAATSLTHEDALYVNRAKIPLSWQQHKLAFAGSIGEHGSGKKRYIRTIEFDKERGDWGRVLKTTGGGFGKEYRLVYVVSSKEVTADDALN